MNTQLNILKRKIKGAVKRASVESDKKSPVLLYSASILVLVIFVFCIVNLVTVSVLSPRGKIMREYNDEKNALVEENRVLEQKIAERMALEVITNRAQKELSMKRVESVLFVKASPVAADASVPQ